MIILIEDLKAAIDSDNKYLKQEIISIITNRNNEFAKKVYWEIKDSYAENYLNL